MLTFCWTLCSLEKVTGFPVWSVSTRAPSLTRTLTLSVICMAIPSHVVVSMRSSAAEMYTPLMHKVKGRAVWRRVDELRGYSCLYM